MWRGVAGGGRGGEAHRGWDHQRGSRFSNKQIEEGHSNYFEAEPVPKKDKLTKLKVEVGEGKEVTIVTNAKHCDPEKVQNRIKD